MSIAALQLDSSGQQTTCVVVGLGLVGTAIARSLSYFADQQLALPARSQRWQNEQQMVDDIISLSKAEQSNRVELIWAAGKAGFAADDKLMRAEYKFYCSVLSAISKRLGDKLTVSFLSSAGGIYEHSGLVTDLDDVSPSRPYAVFKLKQEDFLNELGINKRVYRISTVYGLGGGRIGLISAMLKSANSQQPMTVYANPKTLRDYVYNVDIATSVVKDILANGGLGLQLLASGRPTSIASLLNMVRRVTKKSVLASFVSDGSNDQDIVFERHLAAGIVPNTSLEEGVWLTNKKMLGGFST